MERSFILWLTGLPGSGKTTIANNLAPILKEQGLAVEIMDGDEVRQGISQDLGFSRKDREEHAARVVYICKLLSRNNIAVIVCLIHPYRTSRQHVRQDIEDYIEVYVKASIEECVRRDPKGLYKKAMNGEIKNMTGIDDPYEEPINPDLVVDTEKYTANECVAQIMSKLHYLGYIQTDATTTDTRTLMNEE